MKQGYFLKYTSFINDYVLLNQYA